MKKIHPLLLSVLSGILLFAAWPVSPFTFFIFIAFVPLLWLEQFCTKRLQYFGWCYLTMFIWNAATTWWIINSTVPGAIAAILANSFLMCIPWLGFYNVKKRMGGKAAYLALIFFWLTFEYIHLHWDLSWPWLTLGNVFAMHPAWAQWFQYTGKSGGGAWILAINILIVILLKQKIKSAIINIRYVIFFLAILILPFLLSYLLSFKKIISNNTAEVVAVQPNVDPWDEKFVAGKQEMQLQKLIQLSRSNIDTATDLVVWPETAIPVDINEEEIRTNDFMLPVWNFLQQYPHINLLTGMEGYRIFDEAHKTTYSEKVPNTSLYYNSYNSAVLLNANGRVQVYHKSKLVPGVETLPFFLHFLDSWFEKFGGTTGGYTGQSERTVLSAGDVKIAPAICYESIYGGFMSEYIENGANIIVVITNDGWWGNTAGYKQHMNYARLLAVETGCWVVHCANTGISCFINPHGKVYNPQSWNTVAVIKMDVPLINEKTFFVLYDDIISKLAIIGAIIIIIWDIVVMVKRRKKIVQ